MPTPPKKSTTELVEVQHHQIEDLSERLGILNEVVSKRQEEADALKYDLMQTHAQIASAKHQWEQAQARERDQFAMWAQQQKEAYAQDRNLLELDRRRAQDSVSRAQAFEEEARLKVLELNAKTAEFDKLSQDRLDTAKLRQQAEAKMTEAQTLWGQAQEQKNQGMALMVEAQAIQAKCEAQNLQMQDAWNKCRAWEEELRIRARDVEVREKALAQHMVVPVVEAEPVVS